MTSNISKILVVGGSYGGIAAIKSLIGGVTNSKISITLIEPRAGFINIIGIPRALNDLEFAKSSYSKIENWNIKFDNVISTDEGLVEKLSRVAGEIDSSENLKINYIQGKCTKLTPTNAHYVLVENQSGSDTGSKKGVVDFDYCVFAAGRRRKWPFNPTGKSSEQYIQEMSLSSKEINSANSFAIIGGGALGIEIACELKSDFPDKTVKLIHPYESLPPEKFVSNKFKDEVKRLLREVKVELVLGKRVVAQNGDELILSDGQIIKSDLTYWCNSYTSNIEPVVESFSNCITPNKELHIKPTLQLASTSGSQEYNNVFVSGDLIDFEAMKRAGVADYTGALAGRNILQLINEKNKQADKPKDLESLPPLDSWPHGIILTFGKKKVLSEHMGVVEENNPEVLNMYSDYCTRLCFDKLGIN